MRFRIRSLSVFVVLIAMIVGLYHALGPTDGIIGEVRALVEDDETVWPVSGYSHNGFRAVRTGMSRNEVYRLIGPPISAKHDYGDNVFECWTWAQYNGSYRRREIIFRGDKVVQKVAGFYID